MVNIVDFLKEESICILERRIMSVILNEAGLASTSDSMWMLEP